MTLETRLEDGELRLYSPKRNADVNEFVSATFEAKAWDRINKRWSLPLSHDSVDGLLSVGEHFPVAGLHGLRDLVAEELTYRERLGRCGMAYKWSQIPEDVLDRAPLPPITDDRLYEYQQIGAWLLSLWQRCFISDPTGVGKTVQALIGGKHAGAKRPLIICPANVQYKWGGETERWWDDMYAVVFTGGVKIVDALYADALVMSYDMMRRHTTLAMEFNPDLLILDESHEVKSSSGKTTAAVMKIVSRTQPRFRFALSANPMPNRPVELVSQLKILGRLSHLGGEKWFMDTFVKPRRVVRRDGREYWDDQGIHAIPMLRGTLDTQVGKIRRRRVDVMPQLPQLILDVQLVPASKKYVSVHNKTLQQLQSGEAAAGVTTSNALKRQAAIDKMEHVIQWCTDHAWEERKIIVFAHHRSTVHEYAKHMGMRFTDPRNVIALTGEDTGPKAEAGKARFQDMEDPSRVLVCTIGAFSVGENLTAADKVLFAEMAWRPSDHAQALSRCYGRLNDLHGAHVLFFITEGSVDETILPFVARKEVLTGEAIGADDTEVMKAVEAMMMRGDA